MARPREFGEEQVLAAARREFRARGYAATSVNDLTAATGLGKGSLYGAFGDKHALFIRSFDGYCSDAVDQLRAQLDGPDADAWERVRAYALATAHDSAHGGCMLAQGTAELARTDPDVAARTHAAFAGMHAALTDATAAAQRAGALSATADPSAVAATILATLRGVESLGTGGLPEQVLVSAVETVLDAVARG